MPRAKIAEYQIDNRFTFSDGGVRKQIGLTLEGDPNARFATIRFGEPAGPGLNTYTQGYISVTLPTEEYRDFYDILRHEAPVYLSWDTPRFQWGSPSMTLDAVTLETSNFERPGEGDADPDA